MEFPKSNKIHRDLSEKVGDNAELLNELLRTFQWRRYANYYFAFLGVFLLSVFLIIITIRFAFRIF